MSEREELALVKAKTLIMDYIMERYKKLRSKGLTHAQAIKEIHRDIQTTLYSVLRKDKISSFIRIHINLRKS